MRVLIIDNYDSFVYNLAQYVGELGADPLVFRNDSISLAQVAAIDPQRIILSPGPGNPAHMGLGICYGILQHFSKHIPTLGVCLGHQAIIHFFGGKIRASRNVMHGKTSKISHDGRSIFRGVRNPFIAARYHSLVGDLESLPSCLKPTSISLDDNELMGVRHEIYPIEGVQFHPESILTPEGKKILKNFLDWET